MSTVTPTSASPVRLFFWRVAAVATDVALRNRSSFSSAWPLIQILGGGLLAYALGRLFGAWALSAIP
jgi:hypothetical protein